MLLVYGYGVGLDIRHLRTGFVDYSRTPESRSFLAALRESQYFDLVEEWDRRQELDRSLQANRIVVGITIPENYAQALLRQKPVDIDVQLDATNPYYSAASQSYLQAILRSRQTEPAKIEIRPRYWFNEELLTKWFIIPGLIPVILMAISAILASNAFTREKERGTLERLALSPIPAFELVTGKWIAYQLIGTFNSCAVIGMIVLWFRMPLRGDFFTLLACCEMFLLSAIGIGMLISAFIPSQQVAMFAAFVSTWAPSVLLSGFSYPIRSMPGPVQVITYALPARYFTTITRDIWLKGAGWKEIWPDALPMALLGLGFILGCMILIRKRA
jgi:ABC-2 type transport system permease protein